MPKHLSYRKTYSKMWQNELGEDDSVALFLMIVKETEDSKHYDLTVSWPSCYLTKELLDKSKPVSVFCAWYLILHDLKLLLCLQHVTGPSHYCSPTGHTAPRKYSISCSLTSLVLEKHTFSLLLKNCTEESSS